MWLCSHSLIPGHLSVWPLSLLHLLLAHPVPGPLCLSVELLSFLRIRPFVPLIIPDPLPCLFALDSFSFPSFRSVPLGVLTFSFGLFSLCSSCFSFLFCFALPPHCSTLFSLSFYLFFSPPPAANPVLNSSLFMPPPPGFPFLCPHSLSCWATSSLLPRFSPLPLPPPFPTAIPPSSSQL